MKLLKPKFWQHKFSFFSLILLPISLLVLFFINLKKLLISQKKFDISIICVGNIYIGGTGKTPLSLFIQKELKKLNKKPVIVKKFYANQQDEHLLIKNKTNSLIFNNNRSVALKEAIEGEFDVAILDDGFQDQTIKKDINILCFNEKQLIGNGLVIPSGPLRESFKSIKNAQIIVINGNKNYSFEKEIFAISKDIKIFYSKYYPIDIKNFKNKNLYAFAGIGNPENFFDLLVENNLKVKKKVSFPDHYEFSKKEVEKIIFEAKKDNLEIITTEKDYLRLKNFGFKKINYLKIKVELDQKDKLIRQILNYL